MGISSWEGRTDSVAGAGTGFEFREIVMGLRLHRAGVHNLSVSNPPVRNSPVSLNALCVLQDQHREVLEVIHPGHLRNASGSVVHTGSPTVASGNWDNERIFVFLDALPRDVARIVFVVAGVGAPVKAENAYCHISERNTEHVILYRELHPCEWHGSLDVAALVRSRSGWRFSSRAQPEFRINPGSEVEGLVDESQTPIMARSEGQRLRANG